MNLKSFLFNLCTVLASLLVFFLLAPINQSHAAALTWDGGGVDNNWSTCANWTTDACPVAADTLTFNGTSTKDSTVDASFGGTITSITIASGYTGTITLARSLTTSSNFSQAAGTFNGDGQVLDINGTYSLTAGVFTAPSTTMSVASTFTISGSPTFNHNGGTVTFDGGADTTLTCNNVTFNLVTFAHTSNSKTISSNCALPLGNNPTVGSGAAPDIVLNGTLSGSGTLTIASATTSNLLALNSGSNLLGFTGLVSGVTTLTNVTYNFGSYSTFDVNGAFTLSSGTFTAPSGTATFASTFTISGGTFNANGGTVTFDGTTATLNCNNATFNLVTFAHTSGIKTMSSNCNMPLGTDPTLAGIITLNGTLSGSGTLTTKQITLNAGAILSGFSGIVVNGSFGNAGAITDFGNYTTVDFNGTFSVTSGSFTAPTGIMTAVSTFSLAGGTFNANGGTVTFDGASNATLSCNNTTFNFITFANTAGTKTVSSNCSFPLGSNPTVGSGGSIILNGTLSGSGTYTTAGDLTLNTGSIFSGFNGFTGDLISINGATVDFSNFSPVDLNSFQLISGSFTAPAGTMTVGTTFSNQGNGTFIHNNGTVVLDNPDPIASTITANSLIVGSTTFYNLTRTLPGTLAFLDVGATGKTTTVQGILTLKGTDSEKLLLRYFEASGTTQWNIDAQGLRYLSNLDVQDSNNINATVMLAGGSIDSGNNIGWNFTQSSFQFDPLSPGNNAYTRDERPTFIFKANSNQSTSISNYKLEVDNGETGDFSIDNIPPTPPGSGTTDQDRVRDFSKYRIYYENFSDNDNTNNHISIQTKSSHEWGDVKEHNDGKLKSGKRRWSIKATDGSGNTYALNHTLFVDFAQPNLSYQRLNEKPLPISSASKLIFYTTDQTPTIKAKLQDNLSGGDKDEEQVASGPESAKVTFFKKNFFGQYKIVAEDQIDLKDKVYEEWTDIRLTDNSRNIESKYAWFALTPTKPLPYGAYKLAIEGVDKVGHTTVYETFVTISSPYGTLDTIKKKLRIN